MLDMFLNDFAIGDIARVDDDAADLGIVQAVLADRFQCPPRAFAVARAKFDRRFHLPGLNQLLECLAHVGHIVAVNQIELILAQHVYGVVAQQVLYGGTLIADYAVGIKHGDNVHGTLGERLESPLRRFQCLRYLLEIADIGENADDAGGLAFRIGKSADVANDIARNTVLILDDRFGNHILAVSHHQTVFGLGRIGFSGSQ